MEGLIKVQSQIEGIEELMKVEQNKRSSFDYQNYEKMIVETYTQKRRIIYEMLFEDENGIIVNPISTHKLEIRDFPDFK